MSRLRPFLVRLTAACLSVHLLMMAGAGVVAFALGGAPPDLVCTCAHGADHGDCPMHRSSKNSTQCRLQSPQSLFTLASIPVLGPLVLSDAFDAALLDPPPIRLIGYASPLPSDWIVPPEPPPPRF